MDKTAMMSRLEQVLSAQFTKDEIDLEPARVADRVGGFVVSDRFDDMDITERQRLVWTLLRAQLTPDELQHVGMIFTVTPEEVEMSNS